MPLPSGWDLELTLVERFREPLVRLQHRCQLSHRHPFSTGAPTSEPYSVHEPS
jgi:hypothetical protein